MRSVGRWGREVGLLLLAFIATSCDLIGTEVRPYLAEPFPAQLSKWRLFERGSGIQKFNKRVLPYDLNTPLFSDYAAKYRFVWMPEGTAAKYNKDEVFDFPVGTILGKSFAYPDVQGREQVIETRLLVRTNDGWKALPYVWNAEQTDAKLEIAASPVEMTVKDSTGAAYAISYSIPNQNECAQCHERSKTLSPIGPKARNLNRDFVYTGTNANQIDYWTRVGYLQGVPASDKVPKVPIWNEPGAGTLEARARAYLDNNCAHCHQPGGVAGYTGSWLRYNESDPLRLGMFKLPNSAGYTGGRPYDIVPGHPADSILLYRMESVRPKEMMPEIGRAIPHREGIELVRAWIASMKEQPVQASQ
jgi:uncharacterized repeat protein (TIGR03806 family)